MILGIMAVCTALECRTFGKEFTTKEKCEQEAQELVEYFATIPSVISIAYSCDAEKMGT